MTSYLYFLARLLLFVQLSACFRSARRRSSELPSCACFWSLLLWEWIRRVVEPLPYRLLSSYLRVSRDARDPEAMPWAIRAAAWQQRAESRANLITQLIVRVR